MLHYNPRNYFTLMRVFCKIIYIAFMHAYIHNEKEFHSRYEAIEAKRPVHELAIPGPIVVMSRP